MDRIIVCARRGNRGVAVSLLLPFTFSFSPMKYQQNENSVHMSAPVSPTDVCMSYL